MDPVKRILVTLPEIHGAGAERVARPAGDPEAAPQCAHVFLELGLTLDHLFGRIPIRPFLLVPDRCHAGPGEALPADSDTVSDRPSTALHQIEEAVLRVDDDR